MGALLPHVDFDGSTGGAVLGDVDGGEALVGRGAEGVLAVVEGVCVDSEVGSEGTDASAVAGADPAAGGFPAGGYHG